MPTPYFNSDDWWNPKGVFAALHQMTPARVAYIRRQVQRCLGVAYAHRLDGLTVLDIGCGGGLLAEPLARLGARVTAIDPSTEAIATAQKHANLMGLDIAYRVGVAEDLIMEDCHFDLIIASEVIEHIAKPKQFLKTIARLGHKKGEHKNGEASKTLEALPSQVTLPSQGTLPSLVVLTTINRSLLGVALGKYAAEYILGLVPKGVHDPKHFIRPSELRRYAFDAGIIIDDITGIRPSLREGFRLGGPPLINYAAAGLILTS